MSTTVRRSPLRAYDQSVPPFRNLLVALPDPSINDGLLAYAAVLRAMFPGMEVRCIQVTQDSNSGNLQQVLTSTVAQSMPGVDCQVVTGDPLDEILEAAADRKVDVILIALNARDRRRSLARRLAMKASCSVWIVPEKPQPPRWNILAPIDFSRRAADTLEVATAIAEAAGTDTCLAPYVYFNHAAVTFDEFDDILAGDQFRAFGIFIAPINLHGVFAKPLFLEALNVAQAIVRTAAEHECDLIVMGTRGRSTSAAVLLGSETEQCIMTTEIPLLAVKHFGASLPLMKALRDERLRRRADERFT